MSLELNKVYEPKSVEEKWYKFWLEKNYFHANTENKKTYSIVIPPPNITGSLHMGHALNNTLQDILIRFKRMQGFNALWMPGTDHAGIATQNVVERMLKEEGLTKEQIGREEFLRRVWQWKEKSGGMIINQLKRLGSSCDWERERFTMDEGLSRAVREVFVRLYKEGLIYQGSYIINWCPRCQTALSDIEVEHEKKAGKLWYIKYFIKDSKDFIEVATTRPETMLGDTAVAVNPDDNRYKAIIGQKVILPILNKEIPIIADKYVDPKFGTGVVKITPAHDPNDFEVGVRHNLEKINVMNKDATMNENAGVYKGLDRYTCREKLVEDLKTSGNLSKVEPYELSLGHCYRCKTAVEPYLSKQWFVKIKDLAIPAIDVVKKGKVKIVPAMWKKVYYEWMNNIRDWCISRQLWWGHRIPVWYCQDCERKEGQGSSAKGQGQSAQEPKAKSQEQFSPETELVAGVIVSIDTPEKCPVCGSNDLRQDSDVLDTWFSSGLWPFSTLGWPDQTEELKMFYPTAVLITGFDILFFWVARMIMQGLKFMDDVPFKKVYIHALVRDAEGQKMSKSKGNVIDPLTMMDKYGTDAFRFTLAAFTAQGRDICLAEERIEGYRNFANKLWNASRFVIMNLNDYEPIFSKNLKLILPDKWIITRCNEVTKEVTKALDAFRFNEAAQCVYNFVWHEFCDWYIEFAKGRLYNLECSKEEKRTAQYVLLNTLEQSMRLLHPFMPFITEEIWQMLQKAEGGKQKTESIMISPWPKAKKKEIDAKSVQDMNILIEVITAIRNIRGEMKIEPGRKINVTIKINNQDKQNLIENNNKYIMNLTLSKELNIDNNFVKTQDMSMALLQDIEIYCLAEINLDVNAERARLFKEKEKIEKEQNGLHTKLSNEDFINKAPKEVVDKQRNRFDELQKVKEKIEKSLANLG